MQLSGIPIDDPKARVAREFLFAQGDVGNQVAGRAIVLVGNKTSAGIEPVETLGEPLQDEADCFRRAGRRSRLAWMYRILRLVAPQATVYIMAVAENGTATASAVTFTIATSADGPSALRAEWGGRRWEIGVASGDTANAQATAMRAKLSADPDVPFSISGSNGAITITAVNLGPLGDQITNAVRMRYTLPIASTVTKGSITSGTGADDYTNALAALANTEIYYHAADCTANAAVLATDNGVGEYCDWIRTQGSPTNGKDQQVLFGIDGTSAEAAAVATSSAANLVPAAFYRVHGSDWTTGMVAAHHAGVRWLMEQAYPAASLTGYTHGDATPYYVPDPYNKANRPTSSEITADLNNGVTPVCFTPLGVPYLNRAITSYSVLPGTANKDYRAREVHIPSVIHAAWAYVRQRWMLNKQPNVMGDQPAGQRPIKGFNTPGGMKKLLLSAIDILSSSASPWGGMPILDPDPEALKRMRSSVYVEQRADGFGVSVSWEPVRHDNRDDFRLLQGGPAY